MTASNRRLEIALFLAILLVGALLRLVALDTAPPGLTHDEADHGLDAAGVLAGDTPIYFTVGYGREPLFDYVTAPLMLFVKQGYLASRLTAAVFGIALLILSYVWTRQATGDRWLALAMMAGLAVGFWPVSTARQALRSETLPVLFMGAAILMWHGLNRGEDDQSSLPMFALAGLLLGLTFYTYLAARVMWAVFPALIVYLIIWQRQSARRLILGILLMLIIAAIVAAPLALYLSNNPAAEVRLDQLSGPVDDLMNGDPIPLLTNIRAGLGMFSFYGDDLWLYNIPGKPLLTPAMSLLFYGGLILSVVSIFRRGDATNKSLAAADAFMLLTLAAGLVPALVTGVGASNTRVIGLQPALYYFPARAAIASAAWAHRRIGENGPTAIWAAYSILIVAVMGTTIHQYFNVWANARDVRVAYHTTLVETLRYLDAEPDLTPDVALSTITPGEFHDPAVAAMVLRRDDLRLRWFDGRSAFVVPSAAESTLIFPQIALPDPLFDFWLGGSGERIDQIELRSDDFNRTVDIYHWRGSGERFAESAYATLVDVGDVLLMLDTLVIPTSEAAPGDVIEVMTLWHIKAQTDAEIVLFSHAIDEGGTLVAQNDVLSFPTTSWYVGDAFAQIHRLTIPQDATGTLRILVGAYTAHDLARFPLADVRGDPLGDAYQIDEVRVVQP